MATPERLFNIALMSIFAMLTVGYLQSVGVPIHLIHYTMWALLMVCVVMVWKICKGSSS